MNELIKVTAARPHSNEFGDDYFKAEGESYFVPRDVAESLFAGGWINQIEGSTDGDKGYVQRGKGTGTGAGSVGESGDAQVDGAAGA